MRAAPAMPHPARVIKTQLVALSVLALVAPAALADDSATLVAGRTTVLTGSLSGAAAYGPFVPVSGEVVPEDCVSDGCEDVSVRVVVPRGRVGRVAWAVDAPATGFGVDLRIYDAAGSLVSSRQGGGADTPSPSTTTYGTTSSLRAGTYVVRTSITGGAADYRATLDLALSPRR